jgi:YegS/Rv2252/BmrU family lipid kinase
VPRKNSRAAIIYYPGRVDLRKLRSAVEVVTSAGGWEPTLWLKTDADETGAAQALRAIAQKATHLVVAGGDGTVRTVLEAVALSDAKVTVGIVPAGTGNVLARNLGIALDDLRTQVQRALQGIAHPIDMGLARIILDDDTRVEKLFAVMAGLGLDAKIMLNTDAARKERLGWIAYVESGFKTLPLQYQRLTIQIDGRETRNVRVLTLLIGNVGWLPGKLSMMPDAALDDGLLDVAVIGPRRLWDWIDFWTRVTIGNNVVRTTRAGRKLLDATANVKTLENLTSKKIRVTPESKVELQLDGDAIGVIQEVEFEAIARAVSVRS